MQILQWSLKTKMLQNLFQCTGKTICKYEQFLSYIQMIRKQSTPATPMIKSAKIFYEKRNN